MAAPQNNTIPPIGTGPFLPGLAFGVPRVRQSDPDQRHDLGQIVSAGLMTPPSQSRDGTAIAIAIPTVKQHLASLRMLFDWLITGQVIDANPTAVVRTQARRESGRASPRWFQTKVPLGFCKLHRDCVN